MSFSNNVSCELTTGINASVTSITINAAVSPYSNPPSSGRLVLADSTYNPTKFEIITYTGLTDNTTTLILTGVTRGQEGTSGTAFDANDEVYMSITAADMDATLLDADIGVTVQAYNATYVVDADIGVNVQAYDATYVVDADIGVNVEAFDASILKDADIGVNVQAYSAVLDGTQQSFTTVLKNKLDLVEASADVTDTVNVTAAGALMDTEVDADIKTLSLPASTTISATAKTLLDDASISAMRTTLGVDAAGTINYTLPFTNNSTNWNTAFGWGDHSGLYSLAAHNHTGTYQPLATVLTNTTASFLTADETKLDFITATQAVNLDTIETRIDALDQVVILMGTFSASGGVFPGGGTAQAGESWISTTAGTINGMAIGIDDRVIAVTDNAGTGTAANWHKQDNTDLVQSVAGQTGVVTLAKADVGLGNVTNTSDANKPVSTAQQTALNLKANLASPTFTGTVNAATITASGAVTGSNLAVTNWNTAHGWGDHSVANYLGKGTDIPSAANLDTYLTTGFFHQNSNANAVAGSNYPVSVAGMLTVKTDGNMVYQQYHQYNTGKIWTRGKYNTSWSAWTQSWGSADFANNSANWNTAFGWGDHSVAGYTGNQAAGTGLTGTTTLNVIGGTGITANADDISLTAAGAGAAVYGSTSNANKIDQITLDAYGRVTAISTGGTGSMSSFNVQSNAGTTVAVSQNEELNFINGTNTTATVTNQTNPTVRIDSVDTIYTHPSNATTNVNTSGAEVIDQLSTSAEGHVTVLSKRTMTPTDLSLGNVTNTSDANKPVSTAQQTALNLKANLVSPTFSGLLEIQGGATGTSEGAEIQLDLADDYDGTYKHYRIDVFQDDLRIGRQGQTDFQIFGDGTAAFFGTLAATLTTAAQPNITSVGTLISPTYTGTSSTSSTTAFGMPVGTAAQRPSPVKGMFRFNDDDDSFEGYDGTAWGAIGGSDTAFTRTNYIATSLQTIFNGIYTPGYVSVYYNGVLLPATDYTATSGTAIILDVGAVLNSEITVIAYSTFSVANALQAADIGSTVQAYDTDTAKLDVVQSWTADQTFKEVTETEYSLTGTLIDPANGTIQYKTLATNTTFTESLANGQSVTLMIDDGTAHTVTWPTITWKTGGGAAPTLLTTGFTVIQIWQVNSILYGALVGNA